MLLVRRDRVRGQLFEIEDSELETQDEKNVGSTIINK